MEEPEAITKQDKETRTNANLKQRWLPFAGLIAVLLLIVGGYYGYLYTSTPTHLKYPEYEHYHIRTQIVVNGESVDFSKEQFQKEYDANSCSADVTGQPVDFHDGQDQMAHIHWRGVTGGEFLKFYGWNLIGGQDNTLGRRYDQGMLRAQRIESAGELLPKQPENASYYVYIGDKDSYTQMDWKDFLNQDLEDFMGKKSFLNRSEAASFNPLNLITQKVSAHGAVSDGHAEIVDGEETEARLERINNLIGNIVIFVQKDEPSLELVQERFNKLSPLHDSVCGG